MIEIELSPLERELVRHWIGAMREDSGHWGDGEAIFPDEAIVEEKLGKSGPRHFTRHHLELILEWAESSHLGLAYTVDELMLIEKIKKAIGAK